MEISLQMKSRWASVLMPIIKRTAHILPKEIHKVLHRHQHMNSRIKNFEGNKERSLRVKNQRANLLPERDNMKKIEVIQ
jgi:hypothetical protein